MQNFVVLLKQWTICENSQGNVSPKQAENFGAFLPCSIKLLSLHFSQSKMPLYKNHYIRFRLLQRQELETLRTTSERLSSEVSGLRKQLISEKYEKYVG